MATLESQPDWAQIDFLNMIAEAFRERVSAYTNTVTTSPSNISVGSDAHRAIGVWSPAHFDWQFLQVYLENMSVNFVDSYNHPDGFVGETSIPKFTRQTWRNALIEVTGNGATPDGTYGSAYSRLYGPDPDNLTAGYGFIQPGDVITEQMITEICEGLKLLEWTMPGSNWTWANLTSHRYSSFKWVYWEDEWQEYFWSDAEYNDGTMTSWTEGNLAVPDTALLYPMQVCISQSDYAHSVITALGWSCQAQLRSLRATIVLDGATRVADMYLPLYKEDGTYSWWDDQDCPLVEGEGELARIGYNAIVEASMITGGWFGSTACGTHWPPLATGGSHRDHFQGWRSIHPDYLSANAKLIIKWTFKHR